MKDKRNVLMITLAVLIGVGLPAVSSAVIVSAECGYSADVVVCEIYADTQGVSLISGGVRLNYNSTELTPVTNPADAYAVQKNENDWYFGDGTTNEPYMDPETATPGEIVYIVGKLDTNFPGSGVSDSRALLGTARFTHSNTLPLDPAVTFGLSLGLGRTTASYVNFVTTIGDPLDTGEVSFGPITINQLGDANADGSINIFDVTEVRDIVFGVNPMVIWADCNHDGSINIFDVTCIRDIVFQP